MAANSKPAKCREITGKIHNFCRSGGAEKVESEKSNKKEQEETTGTRTEKAVIKPYAASQQYRHQPFEISLVYGCVKVTEVFSRKRIQPNDQ